MFILKFFFMARASLSAGLPLSSWQNFNKQWNVIKSLKEINFKTNWCVYWKGFFKVLLFTLINIYLIYFRLHCFLWWKGFFSGRWGVSRSSPRRILINLPSWFFSILIFFHLDFYHLDFFPSWFFHFDFVHLKLCRWEPPLVGFSGQNVWKHLHAPCVDHLLHPRQQRDRPCKDEKHKNI